MDVTCRDKFKFGYGQHGDPDVGDGLRVREYQINNGEYCCYGPKKKPRPTNGKGGQY